MFITYDSLLGFEFLPRIKFLVNMVEKCVEKISLGNFVSNFFMFEYIFSKVGRVRWLFRRKLLLFTVS